MVCYTLGKMVCFVCQTIAASVEKFAQILQYYLVIDVIRNAYYTEVLDSILVLVSLDLESIVFLLDRFVFHDQYYVYIYAQCLVNYTYSVSAMFATS